MTNTIASFDIHTTSLLLGANLKIIIFLTSFRAVIVFLETIFINI